MPMPLNSAVASEFMGEYMIPYSQKQLNTINLHTCTPYSSVKVSTVLGSVKAAVSFATPMRLELIQTAEGASTGSFTSCYSLSFSASIACSQQPKIR